MVRPLRIVAALGGSEALAEALVVGAGTALAYLVLRKAISGELRGMEVGQIARALGAKRFNITWSG